MKNKLLVEKCPKCQKSVTLKQSLKTSSNGRTYVEGLCSLCNAYIKFIALKDSSFAKELEKSSVIKKVKQREQKPFVGENQINSEKVAVSSTNSPADEIIVTDEYRNIIDSLKVDSAIVFVSGKAGTGKTTLIKHIRSTFKENIVVVAPTGVAALNVDGATIHSFFEFPPRIIGDDCIKRVGSKKKPVITEMSLLIIDEISMVRADIMDGIDKSLRINRFSNKPFGGVKLLLIGDLFQLPPVVTQKDHKVLNLMNYENGYFFSAHAIKNCTLKFFELTKVFRQRDENFIEILNKIRIAEDLDVVLPILNQRCLARCASSDAIITLTPDNSLADDINNYRLDNLPSDPASFKGMIIGEFKEDRLPSPLYLALKVGAQVMFTKNDTQKHWFNGTLGQVVEITDEFIRVKVVEKKYEQIFDVKQAEWKTYKYIYNMGLGKVTAEEVGKYIQYPLMLAWAVTIHKSQGKTLENIKLDLGNGAFAPGQVYVALSRCPTLDGIYLERPITVSEILYDPAIKRYYASLNRNQVQQGGFKNGGDYGS